MSIVKRKGCFVQWFDIELSGKQQHSVINRPLKKVRIQLLPEPSPAPRLIDHHAVDV